jgi:predicted helicase
MIQSFKEYFQAIKEVVSEGTEHTYRTAFENLLNAIKPNQNIKIIHEPKRERGFGAPDFRIESDGAIIGYIETKDINENLSKVLKSEQIKKYLNFVSNLIITNYHEFILIINKEPIDSADLKLNISKLQEEDIDSIQKLFRKYFLCEPVKLGDPKKLASQLAERAKIVKEYIYEIVIEEGKGSFESKVHGLYHEFKNTLIEELSKKEFADAYSQTVVYGYFLSFLQSEKKIIIEDASRLIQPSFKLIKEFFTLILDYNMPPHIKWIFQEIVNLINNIDLEKLYESMSFKRIHEEDVKDPYIYFYETFLREFDRHTKIRKGVYYTPLPVVSFITRSIDKILIENFKKNKGFADPLVNVLDFAVGTGTFLVTIFELIFDKFLLDQGRIKSLIKEHLLKNFYGFEYLVAPYAIAHLKLYQLLRDNGYILEDDERFQIYLTDTLDDAEHQRNLLLPALTEEGQDAHETKLKKKILVITGNPPYNAKSKNNKPWIMDIIQIYKPLGEKKINTNDDYMKFIRYAHWKIESSGQGIVGIITNNSFLNGLTQRKMRKELMKDFDEIYILDLHGYTGIRGESIEGLTDENVFDIMQGVSINIFVRKEIRNKACRVFYHDLYGKKDDKYKFLFSNDIKSIKWEELDIWEFNREFKKSRWNGRFAEGMNFFVPMKQVSAIKVYGNFWGITDIFKVHGSGVKNDRGKLVIDFDKTDLSERMKKAFSSKYDQNFIRKYDIKNSSSYKIEDKLREQEFDEKSIIDINYRPFDFRQIYYKVGFTSRPAFDVMQHMINQKNIGLSFIRNDYETISYDYVLSSDKIIDIHCIGGQSYFAPLYSYSETNEFANNKIKYGGSKEEPKNFTDTFNNFIDQKYSFKPTPEEIIGYIYSILYSPAYRKKYLELLKIDFPRIPFFDDEKLFNKLSNLGWELIQHHLMKKQYPFNKITFPVANSDVIEEVEFIEKKGKKKRSVFINKSQYFENVTPDVWEFHIGGYQVLLEWLKSRKDRTLSYQEQETFVKICNILEFTIEQMARIDDIVRDII